MSFNPQSLPDEPSATQQRQQANMLLVRLQWLLILLLIAALFWLYISQQRFQQNINERLQSNEQIVSRLNEMDDRLFSMSQQTLPEVSNNGSNQAQNQLDLLRIQLRAVDRLLVDSNDSAAIELLRGLHWQLSQNSNEIAPALTIVIKQNLMKDIERLQASSAQPNPWQLQNLAIQNIQDFLQSRERVSNTSMQTKITDNNIGLTRTQLTIHEVIMTLNLATQASNMREHDQLISYLTQARTQLQFLVPRKPAAQTSAVQGSIDTIKTPNENDLQTKSAPTDISEVLDWLDQLIAKAPKPTPLLTTQVLDNP